MKTYIIALLVYFALSCVAVGQTKTETVPEKVKTEHAPEKAKAHVNRKNLVDHLPERIKTHMQENYPDIDLKAMSWHKNLSHNYNDIVYQACFDSKGLMVTIELIHDGTVHAKETELKTQDAPKSLEFFLQGHVVKYIAYIEYHDEGAVYIVESSYKNNKFLRAFTASGSLIYGDKWFSLIGYKPS